MTPDGLIGQYGYIAIVLLLVLGGLGLPIPEEAPVVVAAVLSHKGALWWPLALVACFAGVLGGDFVVYALGYFYGERVLKFPLTRKFLTREREAQIKGYFHRHGFKILILGRFAVGFRTAAYLTAGILKLPPLRLLLIDLAAASLSTFLLFGLGYAFAGQIERGLQTAQHYMLAGIAVALAVWLLHRYYKARLRAGKQVGPPVLVSDDAPLPPDDLHPSSSSSGIVAVAAIFPPAEPSPTPAEPPPDVAPPVPPADVAPPPIEVGADAAPAVAPVTPAPIVEAPDLAPPPAPRIPARPRI